MRREIGKPHMHHPQHDTARRLTDHLFRKESGRMISVLVGMYGAHRLQLAEDVVQEALVRALKTWPYRGIPENPEAWLLRTAKNLAIDQLRRETNFQRKQDEIVATREQDTVERAPSESGVQDDQLRLMFVCCHPILPPEVQSALALKVLCGFSPAEIAKAFLVSEAAIAKRLTRARQRLQKNDIPFEIPVEEDLNDRLNGVLEILYLLFNEGYKASYGDQVIRVELCNEAIRLGTLLAKHPAGDRPETHALLALMCLNAARLPARTAVNGELVRLEDQDRNLWDKRLVHTGLFHLSRSSQGSALSEYHLQAGISACHCTAPDDEKTDWNRIVSLYNQLLQLRPSPVIQLNRAVAISKAYGPDVALEELNASDAPGKLENYHLLHAVLGELNFKLEDRESAANHFRRALELAETRPERTHIAQRLEDCSER